MTRLTHPTLIAIVVSIVTQAPALAQIAEKPAAVVPLARQLRQLAAIPGDPHVVSAAGLTHADTRLSTIENGDPFEPGAKRRLVLVGGLAGDDGSARAVLDVVRWMKTRAPAAVRRRWVVSALPLANPDRQSEAFAFPPAKGFFNDPAQPESRYVWRWVTFQAPDLVVVVKGASDPSADALAAALQAPGADSPGQVTAVAVAAADVRMTLGRMLTTATDSSPLHAALLARAARDPLAIARTLASRYPAQVTASYIPSVAWVNMLRLSKETGEDEWRAKVLEQTRPWVSGEKAPLGEQKPLTSIAGFQIFGELDDPAARTLLGQGAALASELNGDRYAHGQGWTDDMFMATSVLSRAGDFDLASRMLIGYASRLQRPDGIFMHSAAGPFAWGRGNGFAAFGLVEALTRMPAGHPARARLLGIFRRQMAGIRAGQAPDGMWRQVIDEPGSYREETATAMLMTAMARGVRLGWLDRSYLPVVKRAWRALAAHVVEDGALVDVCTGTGTGPTRQYYLDRAAIDGPDDRGGAMALYASMEIHALLKSMRP